jgi:HSP20 family protein
MAMTSLTSLTRWNPFRSLQRFDPVTDIDDLFRNISLRPMLRDFEAAPEIRMNVSETEKAYVVSAEIPGVKKDDIEISVEGNQVSLQAEVKRDETHESAKDIHSERFIGKTYRAFTLPQEIESGKCEAHYDNGVLTLTLPKKSNGHSTRVAIN